MPRKRRKAEKFFAGGFSRDARKRSEQPDIDLIDATEGARVFFLTRKQNASLSPTDMSFSRASALGVALDVRARISDVAALAHRKSERGGCSADWRRRRRARFVHPPPPRIVHPTSSARRRETFRT